jgi:hypothetical protein
VAHKDWLERGNGMMITSFSKPNSRRLEFLPFT